MKRADEAIDAALAGLRRAEADPGLEGRVRHGLQRRMAQRDAVGREFGRFVFGWRWVALGLSAVAVLLVVAISVLRVEKRVLTHGAVSADASSRDRADRVRRTYADEVGSVDKRAPPRLRRHSGAVGSSTAEAAPLISSATRVEETWSEGVSFPAPPMPLTQQERLLLRVANHSGPEEVAMLDSSGRAMQDAEETAVFQEFFGRPESVEQTINRVSQGENR